MLYIASISNRKFHLDFKLMVCMPVFKITWDSHYNKGPVEPWVGHASTQTSSFSWSPLKKPPCLPPAHSVLIGHQASLCKTALALASSFPTHSTSQCLHFCESPELLVITGTLAFRAGSSTPQRGVSTPPGNTNKLGAMRRRAGSALLSNVPMV